jgi:hypothetical protein
MASESHNDGVHSFEQSKEVGYEVRDANIRGLLGFGVGMAVVLFIIVVAMIGVFRYFADTQNLGPTASPFENTRTIPPLPRLQAAPHTDILEYWDSQQKALHSYGWVDRQKGIAHIPIDEAMRMVVQQGLRARATPPPDMNQDAASHVRSEASHLEGPPAGGTE